ncbi:MAG: cation diffusion facilitator family transporter [bacterium]
MTWIGSVINILLVIFKLWAGFISNSQALIADGIHSLSDLFTDGIVIIALKWGRKHEDEDHPYGHARIETISSMIVGIFLILVGLGITITAIEAISEHKSSTPGLFAIYTAAISIILKELMYWYTLIIGKRLKSLALIGNAWHHRSDAMSSVAVLIGVGATYFNPDWHLADAYAALFVTFFIVKIGSNLVWNAFKELSDSAPGMQVMKQIENTANDIDGVLEVHDLRARYSGSQIFVELDIVVDPTLTVKEGHDIAHAVKITLLDHFTDVTRVFVHVDIEPKKQ